MMANHPNLYLTIKMRKPNEATKSYPLNSTGQLRSNWLDFITQYRDRIMISSDSKYWGSTIVNTTTADSLSDDAIGALEPIQKLLDQLPKKIARDLARNNAAAFLAK
ncbi:MAG: hypothetical protein HYV33_02440 [Candidatus Kerfeldbacteria bacterium]|nr:hypothetical protein [Candidatus Kerfeldbacteria bacterium]